MTWVGSPRGSRMGSAWGAPPRPTRRPAVSGHSDFFSRRARDPSGHARFPLGPVATAQAPAADQARGQDHGAAELLAQAVQPPPRPPAPAPGLEPPGPGGGPGVLAAGKPF